MNAGGVGEIRFDRYVSFFGTGSQPDGLSRSQSSDDMRLVHDELFAIRRARSLEAAGQGSAAFDFEAAKYWVLSSLARPAAERSR